jgi:chromosome segregation ATPase
MVFQDPLDARLASQLTTLAGATKAYVDHIVGAVTELFAKVESVGESLRDDTAALRDQAGRVIQGMQETAEQVIHRMSLEQQAAQLKIDEVIVSAERKFSEIDQLVARTWSGVEEVTNFAQQLEAQQAQVARCPQRLETQQAQLHQQQQRLEQHLHAQQAQTALTQTALAVVASEVGARPGRAELISEGSLGAGSGSHLPDPWSCWQGGSGNGHYGGKAEVYMDVGEAMGQAMVELLKNK